MNTGSVSVSARGWVGEPDDEAERDAEQVVDDPGTEHRIGANRPVDPDEPCEL